MRKDDCIFCKIIAGEIPSNTIYEDDDIKVIMDIAPATKGHALVLPKDHYDNIYDIDSEVLGKVVKVAQKVMKHATKVLGCDGYNLLQNNGEIAGQTVFHFHMHLIPRYANMNDEDMLKFTPQEVAGEEVKKIADAIRLDV